MSNFLQNEFNFLTSGEVDELLYKCVNQINISLKNSDIDSLNEITRGIQLINNVINLSELVISSIIPRENIEICKKNKLPFLNASLLTIEQFSGESSSVILKNIEQILHKSQMLWKSFVPDEDHVTPEQLDNFYEASGKEKEFYNQYYSATSISLGTALRGFIANIAKNSGKKVFDFGGGIGQITSSMAKLGLEEIYIVETDQEKLDFVQWRDKKCGLLGINYIGRKEIDNFLKNHEGTFDFISSCEVLEHVYDPPELMKLLAKMLKPGGQLFITTSFHVYPHTSHLKKNVKYTGQEEKIFEPLGLLAKPIKNSPIPLLPNWKLFEKKHLY